MKHTKLKNGTPVIETAHPFEGLHNDDQRLAKVKLAAQINDRIKERGIKQNEAAELLCVTQPEVSNLGKGRLSGFTFDRLYRCLNTLDPVKKRLYCIKNDNNQASGKGLIK